jgi:hypothetical protein
MDRYLFSGPMHPFGCEANRQARGLAVLSHDIFKVSPWDLPKTR